MSQYEPNSYNAQLATILERVEQVKEAQAEAREEAKQGFERIDSRVTALEREKWYQRGAIVVFSGVATGLWAFFSSGPGQAAAKAAAGAIQK